MDCYLVTTVPRSRSPMVCSRSERPPRWNTGELSNILPPGFTSAPCTDFSISLADPDPGSGAFLTPWIRDV